MAEDNRQATRKPIIVLFGLLAIWAALIAIGVMRQPAADARKAIFIVATVVAFVVLWVIAMSAKKKN